jgi:hypothetical protein
MLQRALLIAPLALMGCESPDSERPLPTSQTVQHVVPSSPRLSTAGKEKAVHSAGRGRSAEPALHPDPRPVATSKPQPDDRTDADGPMFTGSIPLQLRPAIDPEQALVPQVGDGLRLLML